LKLPSKSIKSGGVSGKGFLKLDQYNHIIPLNRTLKKRLVDFSARKSSDPFLLIEATKKELEIANFTAPRVNFKVVDQRFCVV
jgi:hypothetical protein